MVSAEIESVSSYVKLSEQVSRSIRSSYGLSGAKRLVSRVNYESTKGLRYLGLDRNFFCLSGHFCLRPKEIHCVFTHASIRVYFSAMRETEPCCDRSGRI